MMGRLIPKKRRRTAFRASYACDAAQVVSAASALGKQSGAVGKNIFSKCVVPLAKSDHTVDDLHGDDDQKYPKRIKGQYGQTDVGQKHEKDYCHQPRLNPGLSVSNHFTQMQFQMGSIEILCIRVLTKTELGFRMPIV